ncbi:MAG: DpnD/PcfM family protein [Synergistaceae bacterium]
MKKFNVVIEEVVSETFEILAETPEGALKEARERYRESDFVLSPGNIESAQMNVLDDNGDLADWIKV